ncbi:MAG TPA: hypothetical protein VGK99_01610 [Acidobacteriota bacterium]|jgi:hypothetical protein
MKVAAALVTTWIFLTVVTGLSVGFSWLTALSCLLTVGVLLAAMQAVEARGWALVWVLFALYGGIGTVNIEIEAVVFQILSVTTSLHMLGTGLAVAFAVCLLMVYMAGRIRSQGSAEGRTPAHRLADNWQLRVPMAAFCYVVLYFAAGITIFPYVRHFYAGRPIPSGGVVILTQFVRGLVYAAVMLPFTRWMSGQRWRAGWMLGLCLSVLGGIAPLLPPNEYLPADLRLVHAVEIGVSNFLFGVITALLLVRRKEPTA